MNNASKKRSYAQILGSSSITGGSAGVNYLLGMVRTKFVAILLGPSGVGLIGLYLSATELMATVSGLGIRHSGVREVALAAGEQDNVRMSATVKALRRTCWLSGLLGWVLVAGLSWPLSCWIFGSAAHTAAIVIVGAAVLLGAVSDGQMALVQGMRRIGDLARIQVYGMIISTICALMIYAYFKERGVPAVIVLTALIQLGVSRHFSRKIAILPVKQSLRDTFNIAKSLVLLGSAFMVSAVCTVMVSLLIRVMIVRELGLDAGGIYQAAWALSGMFAGFILGAMGADYYPRLTGVAHSPSEMSIVVNEQTEIAVLLALPGLLATLAFSSWIVQIFYTKTFLVCADLLPWFVLGIFGQVVCWPMGYALFAKGATRYFLLTALSSSVIKLGLTYALMLYMGIVGTSIALPLLYIQHSLLLLWMCQRLFDFKWSAEVLRLLRISSAFVLIGFCLHFFLPTILGTVLGAIITLVAGVLSLRGIVTRLGSEHRFVQFMARLPGHKVLFATDGFARVQL